MRDAFVAASLIIATSFMGGGGPAPTPAPGGDRSPSPREADVPILMYHHLADLSKDADRLSLRYTVAPADFEAQMTFLADKGYHTVSLDQLAAYLAGGPALPPSPVIVTFDDGWTCDATVATPILTKHGLTATFFVYPNAITDTGGNGYVSWPQLRDMMSRGMSIESHTLTHPHLPTLAPDQAAKEIAESRKILEAHLGKPVTAFAYPFGEYNDKIIQLTRDAGYTTAVTTDPGLDQHAETPLRLKRQIIAFGEPIETFQSRLAGH